MSGELFFKGHTACPGCGPAIALKWVTDAIGREAVVSLATGCMEIVSTQYPNSNWGVPCIHSLFENTPAVTTGVSRALKRLGKKGIPLCIGGDGALYDIGFGALSGAMERNEDMICVIYDNENYANTGVQRSGATPFGAATMTSPVEIGGKHEWKKNIAFISAAHGIPLVATASIAFYGDFVAKLKKARELQGKGFRLIVVQAPCIPGWRINDDEAVAAAKLAVETGLWNLFEISEGVFRFSVKPELKSVKDYLLMQGRFKHLTQEQTGFIQEHAKRVRAELEKLEKSGINLKYLL